MYALFGVVIAEGIGFICALMRASYKAGAVLQWMEDTDRRINRLEGNSHKHNPSNEVKKGGLRRDHGKED